MTEGDIEIVRAALTAYAGQRPKPAGAAKAVAAFERVAEAAESYAQLKARIGLPACDVLNCGAGAVVLQRCPDWLARELVGILGDPESARRIWATMVHKGRLDRMAR